MSKSETSQSILSLSIERNGQWQKYFAQTFDPEPSNLSAYNFTTLGGEVGFDLLSV